MRRRLLGGRARARRTSKTSTLRSCAANVAWVASHRTTQRTPRTAPSPEENMPGPPPWSLQCACLRRRMTSCVSSSNLRGWRREMHYTDENTLRHSYTMNVKEHDVRNGHCMSYGRTRKCETIARQVCAGQQTAEMNICVQCTVGVVVNAIETPYLLCGVPFSPAVAWTLGPLMEEI